VKTRCADITPFKNTLPFIFCSKKIEAAITENTEAILATHCFGNPCDVEKIEKIARKYNLKVIYDAAHCFGTKYKGESIFKWGDISTTSFHATKLFHTIEGGAVFAQDPELIKQLSWRRNFGHNGPEDFLGVGINAKNSEFHAAMGREHPSRRAHHSVIPIFHKRVSSSA
jgi:dTDP-4-amino-4,6-dideoxygalactose transaminase